MNFDTILYRSWKSKISSTKGRKDKTGVDIEMRISFDEWCELWSNYGRLPGMPFVVSRKKDIGDYVIGNVFIQHILHNTTEAHFGENYNDYERKITDYAIETGYRRALVSKMFQKAFVPAV